MAKLGEVVRDRLPKEQTESDSFGLLAALAGRYGVSVEELIDELSQQTILARIGRDLLGLQDLARPKAKRGRKPAIDTNRELLMFAMRARRNDPSIIVAEIARRWVSEQGRTDLTDQLFASRVDAARKWIERFDAASARTSLQALFLG